MKDIERIIKGAEGRPQPSTIIKNGFIRLRNDPKRFNKYSPDEQFAIKKAASTGTLEGFVKLSGSGLAPIGAGLVVKRFGIPGAISQAAEGCREGDRVPSSETEEGPQGVQGPAHSGSCR